MFSIPWKHAARHGWELDKDASLFKLWAIHTGERARVCTLTVSRGRSFFFLFGWIKMLTKRLLFFPFFTGKYVEGQACDPKTWKANFRCAMNSLPDVEEVKDKSINKGHQAMRVFRLLPTTPKCRGEITDRK